MKVTNLIARQILDSRGNPTIEVDLHLDVNFMGRASVPSGASTGSNEALELRDKKNEYFGKGVLKAVSNINEVIRPIIINKDFESLREFDEFLIELDGTNNKSNLGGNTILALSSAFLKANAKHENVSLYEFIGDGTSIPKCMINIINGGKHSNNELEFQEFLIIPNTTNIDEILLMGNKVFYNLKSILIEKGYYVGLGDEGGFAPNIKSNIQALDLIKEAIEKSNLKLGTDITIGLDCAATSFYKNGKYIIDNKELNSDELSNMYLGLIEKYNISSIEDPFYEEDFDSFAKFYKLTNINIVGDDLFTTNVNRLNIGIEKSSCNSILIKPNQIGTITETLDVINVAKEHNMTTVVSHRSGETEDTMIIDLAVGIKSDFLKIGSLSRGERIAKYNRLIRINEEVLGKDYIDLDN